MSTDDGQILHDLEVEVHEELDMVRSSEAAESIGATPADWQFDPVDLEREEVGLSNLLGAIEAVESDGLRHDG